jgi:outer membrane lipoprotein-sorting protein
MKTNRRTLVIVLTIMLTLASVSIVAARIIPDADELLARSIETLETIEDGHAVVEVTAEIPQEMLDQAGRELPVDALNGTFEVWAKKNVGANGEPAVRLEVLDAAKPELIGLTAVSDGTQFWIYDPGRNVVVVGQAEDMMAVLAQHMAEHEGEFEGFEGRGDAFDPNSEDFADTADFPETPEEAVAKFLEYFTAERNGSEDMAGSEAYRIRLVPIPEQMPEEVRLAGGFVNVWLRTSDQLPVSFEYAEGTAGYARVTATVAEINTGLDEAIFTFAIPEGVEIVQATDLIAAMEAAQEPAEAVEFEALSPTDVPDSAVAEEPARMGGAVVQRFNLADGQSFFIAQGQGFPIEAPEDATSNEFVTVRGVEGTLFSNDDGTRALLTWQEGEITFLIGGDISPEQALAIAESLE